MFKKANSLVSRWIYYPQTTYFLLFGFVVVFSILVNSINLNYIRHINPQNDPYVFTNLVHNETINSIDNYWYINHIKNYLEKGQFSYATLSSKDAVRRTPLYPLFYGVHYLLFGEVGSFKMIKITQTLLYALASVLLFIAVFRFTKDTRIALLTYFIFATFLPFVTYLMFTITEAVTPALVCILFYFLSTIYQKNSLKNWFFAGVVFATLALFRPIAIFICFSIGFYFVYIHKFQFKNMFRSAVSFGLGSALLFLPWMIHNYIKTNGDIILLEKYYGDQMDYGMPNMHLKYWIASWMNPGDYSSERISNAMRDKLLRSKNSNKNAFIDSLINKLPETVFKGNNAPEIRNAYSTLFDYYDLKLFHSTPDSIQKMENSAIQKFDKLKVDFIKKAPLHHYLLLPLLYAKSLIFQSNASTLFFLNDFTTNRLLYVVKLFLYLFSVLCYASLFFVLFFYKKYNVIFWITFLYSLSTFLIIMYVNKNFEVRYTYTYLPFLFITFSIVCVETYEVIKQKLVKKK